jgi:hypothetical protein
MGARRRLADLIEAPASIAIQGLVCAPVARPGSGYYGKRF